MAVVFVEGSREGEMWKGSRGRLGGVWKGGKRKGGDLEGW